MDLLLAFILSLALLFGLESYWKSFLIGAFIYCMMYFLLIIMSPHYGTALNLNWNTISCTFASIFGKFLVPFILACIIYAIITKSDKKGNIQDVEAEKTKKT